MFSQLLSSIQWKQQAFDESLRPKYYEKDPVFSDSLNSNCHLFPIYFSIFRYIFIEKNSTALNVIRI